MNSSTKLYGLIGCPVTHSLSPVIHNAAFKKLGLNSQYRLFEIDSSNLEDFLIRSDTKIKDVSGKVFYSGDFQGYNITIPHKVKAKDILEENYKNVISQEHDYSALVGAVNVVGRITEDIFWTNTDALGFLTSSIEDLGYTPRESDSALIIGSGGAGRSVISGLASLNRNLIKNIYVYEVNPSTRKSVQKHYSDFPQINNRLKFILEDDISEKIKNCRLLVNASPIGMKESDISIIDKKMLHKDLFVYDVVYNRSTQLIEDARRLGLPACGGLGMLLYQAVAAWELWTKEKAPVEEMKKALEEEFKRLCLRK